jgi:pantoate--beta-alanine ligase
MTSDVIASIPRLRDRVAEARRAGGRARPEPGRGVALVPTMGALHAGHARLIEAARTECGLVIVSIFVNPLQFDRPEDLEKYPRALQPDVDLCSALGVDVVFAPSVAEMYPEPPDCAIDVGRVAEHLCGKFRPGHFRGVATVVMKLFQIAQPDRAYFGEKDAQQLAVIRRMVADFNVPIEIVGVPTVREPDGLALSSRNVFLSPKERERALVLSRALRAGADAAAGGPEAAVAAGWAMLATEPSVAVDYFELRGTDLGPAPSSGEARLLVAAKVGTTRLIDNIAVTL